MGSFRDQMDAARADLHKAMSQPAVYFLGPYDPLRTEVKEITVRVHDKFLALGDLKGTNFNYAELESVAPRIVFWHAEVSPERNYFVSVKPGLAYRIDTPLERDGVTITATVVRLEERKTVGFPVPEGI